jgi:DnaJ-domain-containing protein 1
MGFIFAFLLLLEEWWIRIDNRSIMSSQDFLLVNLFVGFLVFLVFMIKRKGVVPPSKLNLRAPTSLDSSDRQGNNKQNVRILNVIFAYNGHTWDAFEVLGVPAGSSIAACEEAYRRALSQNDPKSAEFLRIAISAIRTELK